MSAKGQQATSDRSQPLIRCGLKPLLDDDFWVMLVTVGDKPHGYLCMPYRVEQAAKPKNSSDDWLRGPTGVSDRLFFFKKEGRR